MERIRDYTQVLAELATGNQHVQYREVGFVLVEIGLYTKTATIVRKDSNIDVIESVKELLERRQELMKAPYLRYEIYRVEVDQDYHKVADPPNPCVNYNDTF